uniref:Uncharacterized protein n=1 Tax=Arundo donax TaxID=35708 RepID=A0A0A9FLB1_ARUDO
MVSQRWMSCSAASKVASEGRSS